MKKLFLPILCFLFVLIGCTNENNPIRHEVAISSDSERIAYSVSGEGKPSLVFIHGWSCDSRYFQNQLPVFAKDYQVIAIDLAGHGNSSQERTDYTMLSFANDIKAVIEKEKIQNAILIGHSMGGGVIAEAAKLMPKEVEGIIGIDTLQNVALVMPQKDIDAITKPFEANFKNAIQGFVAPMLPKETDQNLLNWIHEDMLSAPKQIAVNAMRNYLGQHTNEVFENINIPVVSINAKLWPTNEEENRKYIKDYTIFYIENTGHFPMLEKPKEFNALLLNAIELIESKKTK